jgi:hypothetical protein
MNTIGPGLLVAALAAPLVLLAACLSRKLRRRALALLWFAPLPALAAALIVRAARHWRSTSQRSA